MSAARISLGLASARNISHVAALFLYADYFVAARDTCITYMILMLKIKQCARRCSGRHLAAAGDITFCYY